MFLFIHFSVLKNNYLRLFLIIFLLFSFNSIFSQVYQFVDQNKTWDVDTAKNYLFYKQINTEFTICPSLNILKFKDNNKDYGWNATNPIPEEWDFKIRTDFPNQLDCGSDCKWEDPEPQKCITFIGSAPEDICIYVVVINKDTNDTIPGLDRVKICYRLTDDFTIIQNGFNSCLGTQIIKVNEARISDLGQKICNDYNMKVYLGVVNNSTKVWDSDDSNSGYTANSPEFSIKLDVGDYNYIITNSCGKDITGVFSISDASSFGSKIVFAGYECVDTDKGTLLVKIQGATKPISWNLKKDGAIIITEGNTGSYDYSDEYDDANDGDVISFSVSVPNLSSGEYKFSFTDVFGCTETVDVNVIKPLEILSPLVDSKRELACFGDSNGFLSFIAKGGWTEPFEKNIINPEFWGDAYDFILTNNIGEISQNPLIERAFNDPPTLQIGWKVTFSNLPAGTYTLTVSENIAADPFNPSVMLICSKTDISTYNITQPPVLYVEDLLTNITCNGASDGIIDITVSGGTKDYSYLWSTNDGSGLDSDVEDQSGLGPGTYKVIIKDANDCTIEDSFDIIEPNELLISLDTTTNKNLLCYGDSTSIIINLTQESTPPYSFKLNGNDYENNSVSYSITDKINTIYTFRVVSGIYKVTVIDKNGCSKITDDVIIAQPDAELSLDSLVKDITCNGASDGIIDITVSGGTKDYSYLWSTNDGSGLDSDVEDQSGLGPGTYKVVVTDANACTIEDNFNITQPFTLILTDKIKNTCNGASDGSIDISVSGGTKDYSYLWSTNDGSGLDSDAEDQSGLTAGTYKVVLTDANGCKVEKSFTVIQPDSALSVTDSFTNISCNGVSDGSIDISVSGGTKDYSYLWSTNDGSGLDSDLEDQSGLGPGTYKVVVTDANACTIEEIFTIIQPDSALSVTDSFINISCNGASDGSIDITVSGGTKDYSYLWSTTNGSGLDFDAEDQSGLTAGKYKVVVTDSNDCSIEDTFNIIQPSNLILIEKIKNTCNGASDGSIDITVSGGTKDYSYLWSSNNGSGWSALSEDQSGLGQGSYKVIVTDANGCTIEDIFNIIEPDELLISLDTTTNKNLLCYGDSTSIITKIIQKSIFPYSFILNGKDYNNNSISDTVKGLIDTIYTFNVVAGSYKVTVVDPNGCDKTSLEVIINQPDSSLVLSASVTNVTGNGATDGSINIKVIGGTKDYSYLWSTINGSGLDSDAEDQSGLTAGTYKVIVTDANGCKVEKSFIISQPDALSVTDLLTNISCNGASDGSIDITISGGTKDYSYLWSTTNGSGLDYELQDQSGLGPGIYKVVVTDDNGYKIQKIYTLTQPDVLALSGSVINVTGNGAFDGSIDITISGGTKDYSYLWSTPSASVAEDQTGLGPGTYKVIVTDSNGCMIEKSFIIIQPDILSLSESLTNISCNGASDGTIDITVNGGTKDYSYLWSTTNGSGLDSLEEDQNGLGPGTYKIVVTDDNAYKIQKSFIISQPDTLSITDLLTNISCNGASDGSIDITISGGTKDYSYLWSTTNGRGLDYNVQDQSGLGPGIYKVLVTDANGCLKEDSFEIYEPIIIKIDASIGKLSCNGDNDGSIDMTISGGTKDYFYLWSTTNGSGLDYDAQDQSGLGPGTYKVIVTDSNGCKMENTYTLVYNSAPTPKIDTFYVNEGATLDVLGVLLNDFDEEGDILSAIKLPNSFTKYGESVIYPNGRLHYTNDGSENIIDSISYIVSDSNGCSDTSKVFIIINPINDEPIPYDDGYEIYEGDTLEVDSIIGLLANDVDVDIVAGGDNLQVYIITLPDIGYIEINEDDGSFTYIHDGTDEPNEVCFTYRVFDGTIFSSRIGNVCINIKNRLPVVESEIYHVNEGEVLSIDLIDGVLSNDFDENPLDILSIILKDFPTNGVFVWRNDGTFSYDHDCLDNPNTDFFTYFVTDGEDTTAVADTAYIMIDNLCPLGNNDIYSGVDEGELLYIDAFNGVLNNDYDQNSCDALQVKIYEPTIFGSIVLNPDGSFDYTHDDSENFMDQFTYLLWDGECPNWDTVTAFIRINPVPDAPPVAVNDTFPCINEGGFFQTLTYDEGVLFNDYDLDTGSILSSIIVNYPIHGTLILNSNGTFMYTHDGGESTSDGFTYYVRDNTGLISNTATVYFCIEPINDCPIPVDDIFNINEGDIIDSTLIFNDFDIEDDILQIHITNRPSVGGFSWNNDGTFVYTAPDNVNKPGPEIITFNYILSDESFVLCDSMATVTIIINYENDCPIVLDDSIKIDGSKQSSRIIQVLANDYDPDPDDKIDTTSITIITEPSFGEAIVNINGTITYNHDVSPVLSDYFIYSVKDYEGCEVQGVVNIYFRNVKDPIYKLPNYFTPNGDPINEYFVVRYEYILKEDMSFQVKIYDRYQRIVYEGKINGTDKLWNGINSFTSQIVKTDFYYYEITPIEYIDTPYQKVREKILGLLYLDTDRY